MHFKNIPTPRMLLRLQVEGGDTIQKKNQGGCYTMFNWEQLIENGFPLFVSFLEHAHKLKLEITAPISI